MIQRGFSLVEVMAVLAILAVVTALTMASFISWSSRNKLATAKKSIESVLKLARSKTLASEESMKYGVLFNELAAQGEYYLCKNPGAWPDCQKINTYILPSRISFCAVLAFADELNVWNGTIGEPWLPLVIFKRLTGEFENLLAGETYGIVYIYNKDRIASPCGTPALTTCIAEKSCAGINILNSGVIYEKET